MFSDTFSGIAPSSAPAFMLSEIGGMAFAIGAIRALDPRIRDIDDDRL